MPMRFYERDGIQVPSVTSVLDAIPEEWLIGWRERQSIAAALDAASPTDLTTKTGKQRIVKVAQSQSSNEALVIGKWLHDLAEARFKGWPEPQPLFEHLKSCMNLLINFNQWYQEIQPHRVIFSEREVHGDLYNDFLMRNMPYAGTMDLGLELNGDRYIIDLKSSARISDAYVAQCAAYAWAFNNECERDHRPEEKATKIMVVRLSKTLPGEIDTEIPLSEDITKALELFRSALTTTHIRLGTWGHIIEPDRYRW